MARNTDPTAPWNDPIYKNDPLAPHNDPAYRDDPTKPWNNPGGSASDLSEYEERSYGLRSNRSSFYDDFNDF